MIAVDASKMSLLLWHSQTHNIGQQRRDLAMRNDADPLSRSKPPLRHRTSHRPLAECIVHITLSEAVTTRFASLMRMFRSATCLTVQA